jgi:hypothetical protein
MSTVRHLLLTCSFLAVRASQGQVPREIRTAAGCYSLTATAWSPVIGSDSASHRLPTAVRLDTVRSTFAPGWALSPNIVYPIGQGMPPTWRLDADTMRLVWSNGILPTYVTLVRGDSVWTGDAIAESDDHPNPAPSLPRARVTARQRVCAAAPQ